jgi:hypothetical protein
MTPAPVRPYVTSGQFFVEFLRDRYVGEHPWGDVSGALISTGHGDWWVEALHEMAVLHLTRRLVAAASVIVDSRPEWDSLADREIKQMILDTMLVDYFLVGEIHARLVPAVRAARRGISDGMRAQLRSESKRDSCPLGQIDDLARLGPFLQSNDPFVECHGLIIAVIGRWVIGSAQYRSSRDVHVARRSACTRCPPRNIA